MAAVHYDTEDREDKEYVDNAFSFWIFSVSGVARNLLTAPILRHEPRREPC